MKPCSVAIGACLLASLVFAQNQSMHPVGSLSHVAVADSPDLAPSTGFTLETWIYPITTGQPGTQFVVEKINPTITPEPGQLLPQCSGRNHAFLGPSRHQRGADCFSDAASPEHVDARRGHLRRRPLCDLRERDPGRGERRNRAGTHDVVCPANFGSAAPSSGVHTWLGRIDDVRIWRVARTQADVMSWKNRPAEPHPDLVAAWRFDGNFWT